MAEENGDRREIDKLRAKLEEERFDALKTLINTRFDRSDEKFAENAQSITRLEKKIDEHIATPHNLAAVAEAARAVPPLEPRYSSIPGVRFLFRHFFKILAATGALGGTSSLALHGCYGYTVHVHSPMELTAVASALVPTPTATPILDIQLLSAIPTSLASKNSR